VLTVPKLTTTSSLRRRRALRRLRLARRRVVRSRRGSALVLVLVMTFGMAALVLSGMFLAANASALGKSYDKEADFKYAAEGAIGMGKSRLNNDAYALPDSGFATLVNGGTMQSADGTPVRGLTYNLYVGPTGSTTGQFGRFASVVAEARDVHGARFVRRVELAQESFAKFAYWSNTERNAGGNVISFGGGDQLWGPVWSNDSINVSSNGGATFHDDVGTAERIVGKSYGTFNKGYKENEKRIELPSNTKLAKLPGYAAAGGFSFTAPAGNETQVRTRIEFIAVDLSQPANGDSTGADEGYFRVYEANVGQEKWLRGDYSDHTTARRLCGDFHVVGGVSKFYPVEAHNVGDKNDNDDDHTRRQWFMDQVYGGSPSNSQKNHASQRFSKTMAAAGARCYLGGDPHLVYVEREGLAHDTLRQKGGEDTTFTKVGKYGTWRTWAGTPYAPLMELQTAAGARKRSAQELTSMFPLFRGANPGTQGVIYVNGSVAVSGTLRGRVTLYTSGSIIVVDDVRYATDPASSGAATRCNDILGLLSSNDVVMSDNAIFTPQNTSSGYRNLDDTKDAYLQSVVMALSTSFRVQNYNLGPTDVNDCQGDDVGRGCLYLTGGLIQQSRGAVGVSNGTGFVKRYSYDRCAAINPPPYFPTTGRFLDNRYYEIDPVRFDVATLFRSLTPQP
jgi:hypothetical protein